MAARDLIAAYLMTNKPYGTLYAGVTSDLIRRIHEHREGLVPGFTAQWGLKRLVWFERFGSVTEAIQREKTIKHYVRAWKINLIERDNPHWDDLYPGLLRMAEHKL
jgi:putative endonuclease